jgi:RNA polymerase sigma-70 factor (ECF subfamily)
VRAQTAARAAAASSNNSQGARDTAGVEPVRSDEANSDRRTAILGAPCSTERDRGEERGMAMLPGAIDRLFLRFCRTGDTGALGRVFDRTAPELLAVALHLCGNRADADDLVQRTFLAAIESRAAYDPRRRAVPWLLGILANHARRLQRERAAKAPPTRDDVAPDPSASAAAAELAADVARLRDELGAPYKEVLELHLQADLNAKEIAAKLGRPAGTVRTQLMRALELLRRRLPAGFVAGLAPGVPRLAQLASIKAHVVAHAHAVAASGAAAAGSGTAISVLGSLTMTKKLTAVLAVALLLLAGATALALQQRGDAPASHRVDAQFVDQDIGGANVPAKPAQRELVSAAPDAAPTRGSIRVHLHWDQTTEPAANVGVAVVPARGPAVLQQRLAVSDASGDCTFADLPPGDCDVVVALGSLVPLNIVGRPPTRRADVGTHVAAVRAGATTEVDLVAYRTTIAHGTVVDAFERAVADAEIWLHDVRRFRSCLATRSDSKGHFTLAVAIDLCLEARKAGHGSSNWRYVQLDDSTDLDLQLQLRSSGGVIRGHVVDEARKPMAKARVLIGDPGLSPAPGASGFGWIRPSAVAITSADDGSFELSGVVPGFIALHAWAEGRAPVTTYAEVAVGAAVDLELVLLPSPTVHGTARDEHHQPMAGVRVQIGQDHEFTHVATVTAADGSYELTDVPCGGVAVTAVQDKDHAAKARLELASGVVTEWDPVLGAGLVLHGRVLDAADQPMPGLQVERQVFFTGDVAHEHTDADGRFAFANVKPDVVHLLQVSKGPSLLSRVATQPGQDEIVIHISDAEMPTASLRLRAIDAAGHPVTVNAYCMELGSNVGEGLDLDPTTGVATLPAVRPGTYELTVNTPATTLVLPTVTLRPHEARDLGDVVVPDPGHLLVHAVDARGRPAAACWPQLVAANGQAAIGNPPEMKNGQVELTAPPGHWALLLQTSTNGVAVEVDIESGSTREQTVVLADGSSVPIALDPAEGLLRVGMFRVLVHDTAGRLVRVGNFFTAVDGSISATFTLPPGDYQLAAFGTNCKGEISVQVRADTPTPPVRIALQPTPR